MHNDATNIFNLYQEAVEEQPQMTTDRHGSKMWYLHGKLHREDGAAIERANGAKMWYLHGKKHREDGAAIERADGTKMWYLHNVYHENAEAWAEAVLKERNEMHDVQNVDAFLKTVLRNQLQQSL